jgi:hypothetical protein
MSGDGTVDGMVAGPFEFNTGSEMAGTDLDNEDDTALGQGSNSINRQ